MSVSDKKSILLVVDDWEAQERYEDFFSHHLEVSCAPFAKTGLEMIHKNSQAFDVILVDLSFEDVSPLEFVKRYTKLRKSHSKLLVILDESGHDIAELKKLLTENEHLIPRPFQWNVLLNHYVLGQYEAGSQ